MFLPDGYNGREKNKETEDIDIPEPAEAIKGNKDKREGERHGAQDL